MAAERSEVKEQFKASGHDWFDLVGPEALEFKQLLGDEPGVRFDPAVGPSQPRLSVHLTHAPILGLLDSFCPPRESRRPSHLPQWWWEELRDSQREAAGFIQGRRGSLLADALGGGKTRTAIAGSAHLPLVILCKKSDAVVWEDELDYAELAAQTLLGLAAEPRVIDRTKQAYIIPYSVAARWLPWFNGPGGTLILDEGHEIQNKHTSAAKAAASYPGLQVVILTATPIRNRLASLWSLLNVLAVGKPWGALWEFRKAYCGASMGDYGLVDGEPTQDAVDRLQARLSAVMVKRTRKDLAIAYPRNTRHSYPLELTWEERKGLTAEASAYLHQRKETKQDKASQLSLLSWYRQRVGLIKASACLALVRELLLNNGRVIVWCWHRETVDLVAKAVKEFAARVDVITGGTTRAKRHEIAREWRDGPLVPEGGAALVASIPAANTAISLTACRAQVFLELDWAPMQIVQAEARIVRFGQRHENGCETYYVYAPGTLDEQITTTLLEKVNETERVLGDDGQGDQISAITGASPRVSFNCDDDTFMADALSRIGAES